MPQPRPVPVTITEKLDFAAHHSGVATLGPEQAKALLLRLAELEAMAQRAREWTTDVCTEHEVAVARHILGEDG